MSKPVIFGSAGAGGFARTIYSLLLRNSQSPAPLVRLHAVCEPFPQTRSDSIAELESQQVRVLPTLDDLLREPIEAVWLPVPIPLHRRFTEQALAAGKVVVCEKPAAGCIDDVDAMIAARDTAGGKVAIGFNHLYCQSTRDLKQQLLDGAIGTIRHVSVRGCWPRDELYFSRAGWVGGLKHDGAWVLDSPANNAMAHPVHLALFLLGPTLETSADPARVEAELYRANPIENYDTCGLRITTAGGATLLIALTHACSEVISPQIVLTGDHGSATWSYKGNDQIISRGVARSYRLSHEQDDRLLPWLAAWARGQLRDGLVATLENSRAHAVVISAASQVAPVATVGEASIETVQSKDGYPLRHIRGIEALFARCADERKLPSEIGGVPWTVPARAIDTQNYRHFLGPV